MNDLINLIVKWIFIFLLTIIPSHDTTPLLIKGKIVKLHEEKEYRYFIARSIERHEGRLYSPQPCPAGIPSVGVGHVLTNADKKLRFPLTDKQVDSILLNDIEKVKRSAMQLHPELQDSNKIYTAAYFIYIYGNKYLKSDIRRNISLNLPIINLLEPYAYYRKEGILTYSSYLYNILLKINKIYTQRYVFR